MTIARRDLLTSAGSALLASFFLPLRAAAAVPRLRLTGIELPPVRATSRTVWLFVRLLTDAGLIGLGEPFDAFGLRTRQPATSRACAVSWSASLRSSTDVRRSRLSSIVSVANRWP
jgi:hypothetical protein